jgi:hypothetical protein
MLAFDFSPDGRRAAFVRSTKVSDAVVISAFQ